MAQTNNEITPFFDDFGLRIYERRGHGPMLLLIFSGVGVEYTGWQGIDFVRFTRAHPQHHVLFFEDSNRSWLNAPSVLEQIEATVAQYCTDHGIDDIVTLGNSMGGFMALALADRLGAIRSVAFSPQYSIHPDIVPKERRWKTLRARIKDWRIRDLSTAFTGAAEHFVICGAAPFERQHWDLLPSLPQLNLFVFPKHGHTIVRHLRDKAALHPLLDHAIAGRRRRFRSVVEAAGGLKHHHYLKTFGPQAIAAAT